MNNLASLQQRLRDFAAARDWEQFHTPKNLAMALAAEAGELLELFQWLTAEESGAVAESAKQREAVASELADILIYLSRLADILGIDLLEAADRKVDQNESRYPMERSKGSAAKAPDGDDG